MGIGPERTCKPGFVLAEPSKGRCGGDHFSRMTVACHLQQPTRKAGAERATPRRSPKGRTSSCLALLPVGFTEPDRSPDLLVSSYLTVSPLPAGCPAGGLLSVALSLTSRPVGVTHHCALWSPDFPPVDSAGSPRRDIHTKSTGDHPVRSGPIPLTLYPAWRPGLYSSSSERPYKDSFHRFPSNWCLEYDFRRA